MTIIESIGQYTIARHGRIVILVDRKEHAHETFISVRDARDAALERVDLVDVLRATVH